jgi:hypothetical protein
MVDPTKSTTARPHQSIPHPRKPGQGHGKRIVIAPGDTANAEFLAMGGSGLIPVEQDGGSGTAGSHWDDETFGNELMTGYIDNGANYFTAMSAGSFDDLGYVIRADYANWADSGYIFA